jgi:hypothetical protein
MKRFFYSHPLLTIVLLVIFLVFPQTGLMIPLILDLLAIEMTNWFILGTMLGGPLLTILLAFPFVCVPTLKCLDETLDELWQLKRTRKVFHAPQQHVTIDHAKAYIEQNLKKRKLKKSDCTLYHSETVVCAGIWMKDITFYYKYSGSEIHPTYYLLYTTDQLDLSSWNELQKKINRQLLALETESLRRGCSKPAYAVCILCNGAKSTVVKQVRKIQSYQITKAHVCIGIIPKNNWYLPAYRISDNEPSKLARSLLGKGTFGLKHSTFPYKNNREYTEEFYEKVDHLCNSRLKDNVTDEQRKSARTGIRNVLQNLGKSPAVKNFEEWKTDFENVNQIQDDENQ